MTGAQLGGARWDDWRTRCPGLNYLSLLADARPDGVRGLLGDLPMRVRTAKTPTDVQADVTRICEGLLPRIEEARAFTTILFDRIAAFLSTRPSNEQDSRLRITDAVPKTNSGQSGRRRNPGTVGLRLRESGPPRVRTPARRARKSISPP